uniref:Shisa family member 4 n=1 Tax=Terrapene triunguis TaxID=2587831 RepID=A0A674J4G5_9SAUR
MPGASPQEPIQDGCPSLADEDCLWYLDKNGSWHPGFDCNFFTFCCGNCYQRYCCIDPLKLITERQQKHCLAFSPKTIAGIASAVVLFVAIVATIICCFMCSCCYLYQRRQHMRTPFQGRGWQHNYPLCCHGLGRAGWAQEGGQRGHQRGLRHRKYLVNVGWFSSL